MAARKIIITDTSFSDGAPLEAGRDAYIMTLREKIEAAKRLDQAGVNIIESGRAGFTRADAEEVVAIAGNVAHMTVAAFCAPVAAEVDAAIVALAPSPRRRIHLTAAAGTSAARDAVMAATQKARAAGIEVTWVVENAFQTQTDVLAADLAAALKAGVGAVTLKDTKGHALPADISAWLGYLKKNVPAFNTVPLSVRLFDTLGLGVACGLAALGAGADGIDGVTLPEVVTQSAFDVPLMIRALRARPDALGDRAVPAIGINIAALTCVTAAAPQPAASVDAAQLPARVIFENLQLATGAGGSGQSAEITLIFDGERFTKKAVGKGPVDACYKAIRAIVPHDDALLTGYELKSLGGGSEAQGAVHVRLSEQGSVYEGRGVDADVIVASCRAYVDALGKLLAAHRDILR